MPIWGYFAGKLALNLVFTILIISAIATLADTAGRASFESSRLASTCAVLLLETITFSPTGSAITGWARPKAVSTNCQPAVPAAVVLSGLFFLLEQPPDVLQRIAPWLPTYHFGQIAWRAMAPAAGVTSYGTDAGGSLALHIAVILAWTWLRLVLTAWGYRRGLDRERS